jgi:uncharacterized protein (DUF433 family)
MMTDSSFDRITIRQDQMGGVLCIRGLRIPVATMIGMLANGMTTGEILEAYPDLEQEDINAALQYAALQLKPPDSDNGLGSLAPNPNPQSPIPLHANSLHHHHRS